MNEYLPHDVEWTPEKVGRVWDYYGGVAELRSSYFSAHAGAAIVGRADAELRLPGSRVLDFGSGRGDLMAHLFARGIPAFGLEFSERSAESVRTRFGGEPLFRGIEVAAELPSPFADASFDVVFLIEVVEHLLDDQLEPTVRDVERLLGPGGHVFATTPNQENLAHESVRCPDCGATFHRWQHQRSLTPSSVTTLFGRFEPVKVESLNWHGGWGTTLRRRLRRVTPAPHLLYVGRLPVT